MSAEDSMSTLRRIRPWVIRALSVIGLILIWQSVATQYGAYLVGTPVGVIEDLIALSLDGTFLDAIIATGRIMMAGLLLGIAVGIPVGIFQGVSELFDWIANPFVTIFYILPPAGLIPLFIIWFGIAFTSKALLTFIFAVLPIVINVREGVRNTEDEYLEVGISMGATSFEQFRHILLPGTIPYIVTGIRHGIARAIIGAIVAEIFLSAVGIGDIILESTGLYNITTTIATLLVLAAASLVLTLSVQYLEHRMFPWRAGDGG